MQCSRCQGDNRDTAKFCEQCGSWLARTCPNCGYAVSPRANFCPECGTRLTTASPSPGLSQTDRRREARAAPIEPIGAGRGTPEAERRQLTVLFCDLVDSTVLSGQLDPEELREVVEAYQTACAEVIQRYDGHIAQYLGDGLLVYFGYPRAHEDEARRAIYTGLGMVEAIGALNAQLAQDKGIRLAVRIGIHTGLVVVGKLGGRGREERLALGETPNVAARIQGIAAPDTVVVSAATFRLVQGMFSAEQLGARMLKGKAAPVQVYRIVGESGFLSRLDAAGTRELTPLVGRDVEVTLLLERWAQVQEGLGQVVLLSGEPGIGKSRLVGVLKDHVADQPHAQLECRCSPYHQHSALYPLIDLLQWALGFAREETSDDKVRKLETALSRVSIDMRETVPLLTTLLSLPLPERYVPLALTPRRQRQRTLETLLTIILELAARHPVLFIVEDLHWIDPSTLEFLTLLVDQVPTARIFVLFTYRPEFVPSWGARAHLTPITLNRLPRRLVENLVQHVAGDKALPSIVVQQVVAKTDGVPLFAEELTKMVLESGLLHAREGAYELTGPLPPLAIPATLHDSLMARLDRLAAAKEVAQLGASIGRQFPYDLLKTVSPLDEATLQQALAQLVKAELLYQRGIPPQTTYLFKHALIQEAAYQSLLKSTRQQFHQRIAQVLEMRFAEVCETQPEMLAHHFAEAGLTAQALDYWQRAGQRALARSANLEAIGHLTAGLALLETLPETPARAAQELLLLTTLGPALMATQGYASPEAGRTYARARALCQEVEETPQLARVVFGLWVFYHARAEHAIGRELSEQFLTVAHRGQDPVLLLVGHQMLAQSLFCLGEITRARALFEQALTSYDPGQHRALALLYGTDPTVTSLAWLSWTLWLLGYPDQARQQSRAALTLAHELGHALTRGSALAWAAFFHALRGDGQAVYEQAEAAVQLSTEQALPFRVAMGIILRGWALAALEDVEQGRAQLRQGLEGWRRTGAAISWPYWLGLLADTYLRGAHAGEGLAVVAEALTCVDRTGERYAEAELHRLKGELLLKQAIPDASQAEVCFQQALAVARRQQAKSWELRAAMSLSRLWQQQGQRDEACELLAPLYSWFAEGFDTADLQEARVLLEELA